MWAERRFVECYLVVHRVSLRLLKVKTQIHFNVQINLIVRNNTSAVCCDVLQAYYIQRKKNYIRRSENNCLFLITKDKIY